MNLGEVVGAAVGVASGLAKQLPVVGDLVGRNDRIELAGRVVFVTGAARGIGAEVCRQAYAKGAWVSLVGRTLAPLEQLADELGDRAAAFEADVSDFGALQSAADATVARFGGIDVAVANAGIAPPPDPLLTIDPAEFERGIDIDLNGQWRTIRATLPSVIERRGHVLVVSSIYAFFNGALNSPYAASKAGIRTADSCVARRAGASRCDRWRRLSRLHSDRHGGTGLRSRPHRRGTKGGARVRYRRNSRRTARPRDHRGY